MKVFSIKRSVFSAYYQLAKPGIVYGNSIAVVAGYCFGLSIAPFHLVTFISVLLGTSLIMAGACVFNNYIDRKIDAKMERTKKRALVTGVIPNSYALIYGSVLLLAGFLLLSGTNLITIAVGLIGVIDYIVVYAWAKRAGTYGTLVGAISGSTPPVAGYTAATGQLHLAAIMLFLLMAFWQMAHFYAIAVYRLSDYKSAGIPVLPAIKGFAATRLHILVYIVLFALGAVYMSAKHYAPLWYGIILALVSILWFRKSLPLPAKNDEPQWARKVFKFSLIVLLLFCGLTALVGLL